MSDTLNNTVQPQNMPEQTQAPAKRGWLSYVFGAPKRQTSFGEKTFDWGVYGGLGWIANAVISVWATDGILNQPYKNETSTRGKIFTWMHTRVFEGGVDKTGAVIKPLKDVLSENKAFSRIFSKNPKASAFNMLLILTLCTGGTIVAAPIKWLEDCKGGIVKWLDRQYYGEKLPEHALQAEKAIDNEPKQSWLSVIGGRLFGIGVALGFNSILGSHESKTAQLFKGTHVENISSLDHIASRFGRGVDAAVHANDPSIMKEINTQALNHGVHVPDYTHDKGPARRFTKIAKWSAFDIILSTTAAFGLYVASKFIAAFRDTQVGSEQKSMHLARGNFHNIPSQAATSSPALDAASSIEAKADDLRAETPSPRLSAAENLGVLAAKEQNHAITG